MIQAVVGLIVMLVIGLVFGYYTTDEGVTKGGRDLGQKVSTQIQNVNSDPEHGDATINQLNNGFSKKDIDIQDSDN